MQDRTLPKSREAISHKFAGLRSLPIRELKQEWPALYRSEPPRRVSRELLTRPVAYRIQEQALGGLKPPLVDCWSASRATRAADDR